MKKRLILSLAIALLLIATLALPAVAQDEESITGTVTVGEIISITLTGGIDFGDVTPPVTDNGTEGQIDGSPAVTISVDVGTNVNVDIGIMGALDVSSITLDNWKYSTTFSGTKISIPAAYSVTPVYSDVTAGTAEPFYHWITVPDTTPAGTHTITVSYKAVAHGDPF
jgi:hypothetical protein